MIPRTFSQASRAICRSSTLISRTATRSKTIHIPSQSQLRSLSSARQFSQYAPLQAERRRPPPRIPRFVKTHRRWDPDELAKARPLFEGDFRDIIQSRGFKIGLCVLAGGIVVFYVSNLEEVPVSGRRRFNYISDAFVETISKRDYEQIMQEARGAILPDWDKRHQMVVRIMKRLIPASGLTDVAWEIHVINSPERNAFVIPGGKVFVFTGLFDVTLNEHGMAAVLGHEIAHNQAKHMAERMSSQLFLIPLQLSFFLVDAILGTGGAITQVIGSSVLQYGISLPASRKHESEADFIGLLMMAKACYDPRAAVGVWERMEAAEESTGGETPQFLSTHPTHKNRVTTITNWLPQAEAIRNKSGCQATGQYMNDLQATMRDPWALFK